MDRAALPVFLSVPFPAVNGITVYSINLARGLSRLGYPARILLTETDTSLVTYDERVLAIPDDLLVERLPVSRLDGWGARWGALVRLLHANAPCVYIPNSDYRQSVVSPALRPEVLIVGVAHADEPLHHDHVARLGEHWDSLVCVSRAVADKVLERQPGLEPRLAVIRNGIEMPAAYPLERAFAGPLQLIYHGAFKQQQKRILDFPDLLRAVRRRGVDARLTLIGSGPDEAALREAARDLEAEGRLIIEGPAPNETLRRRLPRYHVYLLNSEFEGMPQALLEAMASGCVPIISDVSGGAREVVRDGANGYFVGVGDLEAFAERVGRLDADRQRLASMSRRAYESLDELGLRLESMARAYDDLFVTLSRDHRSPRAGSGPRSIAAPPAAVEGVAVFEVPLPVRHPGLGRFPSWGDLLDFRWELREQRHDVQASLRERPLWLALRRLGDSYASELALELATALARDGFDARLVGLWPPTPGFDIPARLPVATACPDPGAGWVAAATRMEELVSAPGEGSYVAFDRQTAGLAPRLPVAVRTVVLADRGEIEWLRASELPRWLDGLALTALEVETNLFPQPPPASLMVSSIPYPVYSLADPVARGEEVPASAVVYLGHLDGLAPDWRAARALVAELGRQALPRRLLIAGAPDSLDGANGVAREARSRGLEAVVVECAGRRALHPQLAVADILLVPAAFKDVSLVVLDALGHGCVPVGMQSPGLEKLLPATLRQSLVFEDEPGALARRATELSRSPGGVRDLGELARRAIRAGFPDPPAVIDRWLRLLCLVWDDSGRARARRAPGPLRSPHPGSAGPRPRWRAGWRRAWSRLAPR